MCLLNMLWCVYLLMFYGDDVGGVDVFLFFCILFFKFLDRFFIEVKDGVVRVKIFFIVLCFVYLFFVFFIKIFWGFFRIVFFVDWFDYSECGVCYWLEFFIKILRILLVGKCFYCVVFRCWFCFLYCFWCDIIKRCSIII